MELVVLVRVRLLRFSVPHFVPLIENTSLRVLLQQATTRLAVDHKFLKRSYCTRQRTGEEKQWQTGEKSKELLAPSARIVKLLDFVDLAENFSQALRWPMYFLGKHDTDLGEHWGCDGEKQLLESATVFS